MSGSGVTNESNAGRDALDPVMFDRLVDGELADVERRKLLLELDRQPSGWRRCALAFLEAQSWRDLLGIDAGNVAADTATVIGLGGITEATENASPEPLLLAAPAGVASTPRRRGVPRHWLWMAEMAASFLIAFSLGLWIRGNFSTTTSTSPTDSLTTTAPSATDSPETRTVEVVAEGAGGRIERMQVPLVDNRRLGWWQSQPATVVPEEVRRAVERSGGQIRQQRKYFPIVLPDGSRAVVPIDQIELVPVGNRGMQ